MSAAGMLETAALLGLFVSLAGAYGVLYGLGRLQRRRALIVAGFASYALQCAVTIALLLLTPLLGWWKAFVVLSCAIYFAIPPVTLRCLVALHRAEEHRP
jgi:hypothetical protein